MAVNKIRVFFQILALLCALQNDTPLNGVYAALQCTSTQTCQDVLHPKSECLEGICSNPFTTGCLQNYLGKDNWPKGRTCNSHDPSDAAENGICFNPPFDYREVRLQSQDWESVILRSWVMQIILSELVDVPVSMETSSPDLSGNFYDPYLPFDYAAATYDYDSLRVAEEVGDCRKVENIPGGNYTACAHVMSEVWGGQKENIRKLEKEGLIEPSVGTGSTGKYDWFIPLFTAKNDSSLTSYIGLQGEENRRKLAETFKRPTTWGDYCKLISKDGCSNDDGVAVRAPSDDETGKYFVDGLFKGHFRYTEENDCDANPTTCTGHIVNTPCSWMTYVVTTAYHHNISVASSGPGEFGGSYSYGSIIEIWEAANATKSHVILYFFDANLLMQGFFGTEAQMFPIRLPQATQECIDARLTTDQRCSSDPVEQVGTELGSCEAENHSLLRLIVSSLYQNTISFPEAERSPAYEVINGLKMSTLEINQIIDYWQDVKIDEWGYDPREAACKWVVENLDTLGNLIPRTYPREIREANAYNTGYLIFAMVLGSFASLFVVMIMAGVYHFRKKKVMRYAQVDFLGLVLMGFFMVAVGSVIIAAKPSDGICMTSHWLIMIGYTLELVSLLTKIAAMNKLMQAAERCKRLVINRRTLYGSVGVITMVVVIFLIIWAVIDPSMEREKYLLTDDFNDQGGSYVDVTSYCGSNSSVWYIVNISWQFMLLIGSTVLAYQSRGIKQEFNESKQLALVTYTNFAFLVLRITAILLNDIIPINKLSCFFSVIYSMNTICNLCIYFVPKIWVAWKGTEVMTTTQISGFNTNFTQRDNNSTGSRFLSSSVLLSRLVGLSERNDI